MGRGPRVVVVRNTGDRPVQVGSHYHFFEVNNALDFERETARGMRLNIPAGTSVRFEPGEEKEVNLVEFAGANEWCWDTKARGTNEPFHSTAHLCRSVRADHGRSRAAGRYRTDD